MSLFDENAEVLRNLASKGRDLSQPRQVDFAHVFPDSASAEKFVEASQREGFTMKLELVTRETNPWDAIASKIMIPTSEAITHAEELLAALAQSCDGFSDGWGFWNP